MKYIWVLLKGIAMGAADVVPGVSGGTIAFITGIYDELLSSINNINFKTIGILRKEGLKAAWNSFNGTFLVALFLGIGISLFSLAKGVEWCLENAPIPLWSFFFGLVLASILYVGKQVDKWSIGPIMGIVLGAIAAYCITILPPLNPSNEYWFLFLSGAIAVCAMILPGISGSFILLILGAYPTVIQALSDRDFTTLAVVAAGAGIGLLAFSRILKWLFDKYRSVTIAVLTGFLVGSLNKIWPWKEVTRVFVKHAGEADEEIVPIVERSILPSDLYSVPETYDANGIVQTWTETAPQLGTAIVFMVIGFGIIFAMEFAANKLKSNA